MQSAGTVEQSIPAAKAHTWIEDLAALCIGTLMVSFGVVALKAAGAVTGGTAGFAFLLYYWTDIPFGVVFFCVNLPFYLLSIYKMGWGFTLKTFIAVALVSLFSELLPTMINVEAVNPYITTQVACIVMGAGFIILFRHRASLGGINILALFLQDRYGIRAGNIQLVVDTLILIASFMTVSLPILAASIVGAAILNLIITMNHRKDRYIV